MKWTLVVSEILLAATIGIWIWKKQYTDCGWYFSAFGLACYSFLLFFFDLYKKREGSGILFAIMHTIVFMMILIPLDWIFLPYGVYCAWSLFQVFWDSELFQGILAETVQMGYAFSAAICFGIAQGFGNIDDGVPFYGLAIVSVTGGLVFSITKSKRTEWIFIGVETIGTVFLGIYQYSKYHAFLFEKTLSGRVQTYGLYGLMLSATVSWAFVIFTRKEKIIGTHSINLLYNNIYPTSLIRRLKGLNEQEIQTLDIPAKNVSKTLEILEKKYPTPTISWIDSLYYYENALHVDNNITTDKTASEILSDPQRTTRLDNFDEYFSIALKRGMNKDSAIPCLHKEAMIRVPQHEWRLNRALLQRQFLTELSHITSEHPLEMNGINYCLQQIV